MLKLYENIRNRRIELGMTQDELAKLSGYADRTSIAKIESGKTDLPQSKILSIANALGVTPGELMGWEEKSLFDYSNIRSLPETYRVPRLGKIACGKPILAIENQDDYDLVPIDIKCDFTLMCNGDSMINARIFDGDIVYIRKQDDVEDGEIAAVLIEDEATLKRVKKFPDHIVLAPENPTFKPLVYWYEEMNSIRIIGKAIAFVSGVR